MLCQGTVRKYESTSNQREEIHYWEKYTLTIAEASQYFHIGEKNLRKIVENNPRANYILMVGNRVMLKRKLFEKFIDETGAI